MLEPSSKEEFEGELQDVWTDALSAVDDLAMPSTEHSSDQNLNIKLFC